MPVAFRVAGTDDTTSAVSALQVAVAVPASVVDGDFLLANVASTSSGVTITAPAGWTLIRRDDLGSTSALATYYRVASREPTRWVWSFSVEAKHTAAVRAYIGVDWFYPVDAQEGGLFASAAAQIPPTVYTSEANTLLASAIAATNILEMTPDVSVGYVRRSNKASGGGGVVLTTADRTLAAAGSSADSLGYLLSSPSTAVGHTIALRPSAGTVTVAEVRSQLKGLFPPGAENLYDWENVDANVYKLITAEADWLKAYGYDWVDLLRTEFNPNKPAVLLEEWEGALGISVNVASAVNTWLSTRRAAIISKFREGGACTETNVRAVVEPLLGYTGTELGTLRVVECDREQLRALHTYSPLEGVSAAIPSSSTLTLTFNVYDDGEVSAGGVQIAMLMTYASPELLSFVLTGPTQTTWSGGPTAAASKTWAAGSLGAISGTSVRTWHLLADTGSTPGKFVRGIWTLVFTTPAVAGTLHGIGLFVEGAGYDSTGFALPGEERQGRGMAAYSWGVWADPTKYDTVTADFTAVRNAVARIRPGHTAGNIIRSSTTVALGQCVAIPDDARCFPEQSIPSGDMWAGWTGDGNHDGGARVDVIYERRRTVPMSEMTQFAYVRVP